MPFLTSLRPSLSLPLKTLPLHRTFTTTPLRPLARMTIVGRLADTPEIHATASGQDVVRYALGTSHGRGENRTTSWWKVAFFAPEGGIRDVVLGLGKGSLLYLEGDCQMSKYEREGRTQTSLSIVQNRIEILDKRDPRAEGQEEQVEGGE